MPKDRRPCPKFGHIPFLHVKNSFVKSMNFCIFRMVISFFLQQLQTVLSANFYNSELRAGCPNLGHATLP